MFTLLSENDRNAIAHSISPISIKNRRNGEVGGGTLYHKVFLSRRVAHTMLGTVIIPAYVHLYTCAAVCTALYSYLASANEADYVR